MEGDQETTEPACDDTKKGDEEDKVGGQSDVMIGPRGGKREEQGKTGQRSQISMIPYVLCIPFPPERSR